MYEWTQSPTAVTFHTVFHFPTAESEGELEILISPGRLKIGRKGKSTFVDNELFAKIDAAGSRWKISENNELEIHLQKLDANTWPSIFKVASPNSDTPQ